jgi:hypothetical protein
VGDLVAGRRLIEACAAARDAFANLSETIRAAAELCQTALAAVEAGDVFAGRRLIEAASGARDAIDATLRNGVELTDARRGA